MRLFLLYHFSIVFSTIFTRCQNKKSRNKMLLLLSYTIYYFQWLRYVLLFQLTFPHINHPAALFLKQPVISLIPADIRLNPFFPELRIALRPHKIPAPLMPMPEAPIHKHHRFVLRQHNIRRARQPPVILPVPQPIGKQKLPHRLLRLRILATDPRHIVTSYFRCVDVSHF